MEQFWRTVKYEDVYLTCYESIRKLKVGLTEHFKHYNENRLHQALDYPPPHKVYFMSIEKSFKTLRSLEQLSNTQNDDEVIVLDSTLA